MNTISRERNSIITSLKKVVELVAAVTIAETIGVFVNSTDQLTAFSSLTSKNIQPLIVLFILILQIANTLRFYHGNVRHIDVVHAATPVDPILQEVSKPSMVLVDFSVIIFQAILFALMALRIDSPRQWLGIFLFLMVLDLLWILWLQVDDSAIGRTGAQRAWLINNVVHILIALGVFFALKPISKTDQASIVVLLTIVASNTIVDLIVSREFYFGIRSHRSQNKGFHIFVSAPFSRELRTDSDGQITFDPEAKQRIERILSVIRNLGYGLYSAHLKENWGRQLRTPLQALKEDLQDVKKSDLIIALFLEQPSEGTAYELGFATALRKPVIFVSIIEEDVPYLLRELPNLTDRRCETVKFGGADFELRMQSAIEAVIHRD